MRNDGSPRMSGRFSLRLAKTPVELSTIQMRAAATISTMPSESQMRNESFTTDQKSR